MSVNLIFDPKVYVVGSQIVEDEAMFKFLADEADAPNWMTDTIVSSEELIEVGGRVCYMSFKNQRPGGNRKYIDHLLQVGHGSVLEHAVFTFILTGVSRTFTHELVRHRAGWAYSQLSQRYVDESEVSVVVPPALRAEVESYLEWKDGGFENSPHGPSAIGRDWVNGMDNSISAYRCMSDYLFEKYTNIEDKTTRRKAAREAARSVLPNATETKIVCTVNARALRHFFEMRASLAADREMSNLAIVLLKKLRMCAPAIFGDYIITSHSSGPQFATTPYKKV